MFKRGLRQKVFFVSFLAVCILILSVPSYAQSKLHLKSGKTVEGTVVERTEDYVKIDFAGVTLTYWMDEIESAEFEDSEEPSSGEEPEPELEPEPEPEPEEYQAVEEPEPEEEFAEVGEEEMVEEEEFDQGFEREQDTMESSFEEAEEPFQAQGEEELIEKLKQLEEASRRMAGSSARPGGVSPDMPGMPDEEMVEAISGVVGIAMIVLFFIIYVYSAFCLQTIAKKTGTANSWFAWIPILNVLLMCDIAAKPRWWVLAVFLSAIPVVGAILFMIVWVILWMNVARARGKPAWLGILIFLPLVNFIVMGYLAFSKQDIYEPGVAGTNAIEESRRLREEAKKIRAAGAGAESKTPEAEPGQETPDMVYRPRKTMDDGRGTMDEKKEPTPLPEPVDENVRDISPGADEKKDEGRGTRDEGRGTADDRRPTTDDNPKAPQPSPHSTSPASPQIPVPPSQPKEEKEEKEETVEPTPPPPPPEPTPPPPPPEPPAPQEEKKDDGRGTKDDRRLTTDD